MLRKSLKHEFRATSRVMLPLFIALLCVSVVAHFSLMMLDSGNNLPWVLKTIGILVIVLFAVSLVAIAVGVLILTGHRFNRSFLSDEGYLTMTLPVSIHTHISSRLICAVVWYALTALAIFLSVLLMALNVHGWKEFFGGIGDVLRYLTQYHVTGRAVVFCLELLAEVILGCCCTTLLLYAAMAVGHSFNRGKKGMSVLFAFVFYNAEQFVNAIGIALLSRTHWDDWLLIPTDDAHALGVMQTILGAAIVISLLGCAVFYFITHYFLSRKLNLE